MAPPKKQVDFKLLDSLVEIFCTGEECAGVLDIDYDTLNARIKEKFGFGFSDYFKKRNALGKRSLRRAQYDLAVNGNPTMLIWLGKQYLGQSDKHEVVSDDLFKHKISITNITKPNGELKKFKRFYQGAKNEG